MPHIARIFDHMDAWRHLPSYQLERRADLFFALYVPAAVQEKLQHRFDQGMIPEFPVRIGSIDNSQPGSNQSFKVDYLLLSDTRAALVELKTDAASRNDPQDLYLERAKQVGLNQLVHGIVKIMAASKAKSKYCRLLEHLARMKLVQIAPEVLEVLATDGPHRNAAWQGGISVPRELSDFSIDVVYIQPTATNDDTEGHRTVITFEEFAQVVDLDSSPFAKRFAQSIREWSGRRAGAALLPNDLLTGRA